MNTMRIPVFVINLKTRTDRRRHILEQFHLKEEFDVHIVEACQHSNGAIGLWNSIIHILQNLVNAESDYVLICEDDHQFTEHYSKEFLFDCIAEAKANEADVLLGGVSSTGSALSISTSLFWSEKFSGLQFTILFNKVFKTILEADFGNNDAADHKISSLTNNKFFTYPFISIQKEFGYSDVTVKNNKEGRVAELFSTTSEAVQHLLNVAAFYKTGQQNISIENEQETFDNIIIPTYVINLPERTERRQHIQKQFEGRKEFDVTIIEACKHTIGAVGLWLSILKVIRQAIANDDDVIVICEDDHEFTKYYSKENLLQNIIEAANQGVELLTGGVANFSHAVPITENRLWLDSFWCTQFIIIYKSLFQKILEESFGDTDTADGKLSEITSHKMALYPFISLQKNFGYSDVTKINQEQKDFLENGFATSERRLERILKVKRYCVAPKL